MTDRETIESALKKVRSGELTPAEATELLLLHEQGSGGKVAQEVAARETNDRGTAPLQYESIESLVDRLGNPPEEIVDVWCAALVQIATQHERESNQPLPPVDASRFGVTAQMNTVFWNGRLYELEHHSCPTPSQASLEEIEKFRHSLNPSTGTLPSQGVKPEPLGVDVSPGGNVTGEEAIPETGDLTTAVRGRRFLRNLATVIVIGLCSALTAALLYQNSRPTAADPLAKPPPSDPFASASNRVAPGSGPASVGSSESADDLELGSLETIDELMTLESMAGDESSPEASGVELEPSFSLDELMPPLAEFVESSDSPPLASSDRPSPGAPGTVEKNDLLEGSDDPREDPLADTSTEAEPPDESPQPTRTSPVMSVSLPPIDQVESAVSLRDAAISGLQLEFPLEVPLVLTGSEGRWEIRDNRKDMVVGEIIGEADETVFRWSNRAGQSPAAVSLSHGRITDDAGSTIYMRPVIEADPLPIRFDESDVMPTWNLRDPIPPRVARVSLEFELPDNVDHAWIEPIDPESIRRGRGVAVLTPEDGETVALGIRFDLRCSRKLSCRTRFAARLDPTMPWQLVSTPMLDRVADQLANQAVMISQEATRLSALYDRAGTSERKILRTRRDHNEALADSVRTASQRVAQLQMLIATIEAEASLKLRVWIEWPDTAQEVLTMQTPSPDSGGEADRVEDGDEVPAEVAG